MGHLIQLLEPFVLLLESGGPAEETPTVPPALGAFLLLLLEGLDPLDELLVFD